jgi:hypothetical protein
MTNEYLIHTLTPKKKPKGFNQLDFQLVEYAGEWFLRAEICDVSTNQALALASFDGAKFCNVEGQTYLAANWLKSTFPDKAKGVDVAIELAQRPPDKMTC